MIIKIISGLAIAAICAGSAAVVQVNVLEYKYKTLDERMQEIKEDTEAIRCQLGDLISCKK